MFLKPLPTLFSQIELTKVHCLWFLILKVSTIKSPKALLGKNM